ncbi:MAG TPA: GNAT family N-acetyltransferase [Noviherbaspirillum sp.]
MSAEPSGISLYENAVPSFVEPALETLYEHVFSSMPQFRIYNGIDGNTHTYVARDRGRTTAVLLFRCEGRHIKVLNEQIAMTSTAIERFAGHVFEKYGNADTITFPAIRSDTRKLALPCQEFYRTEDIVLRLPATPDDYLARLGKATRKNMKYHGNRLRRNFPDIQYRLYLDGEIAGEHVRNIIELNRARMATKNKSSDIDDAESERLVRLVQQSGLVSVMMHGGRVVAGTVCSRVGANYFMHINAHDPAYDDARLGKLCCFQTINDCIARGGKEFHFMWGRFEYKYLLLGVQQDFNELVIYRSRAHLLLNGRSALRTAINGYRREWKFRLLDLADHPENGNLGARAVARLLNHLRNMKRAGMAVPQRH